MDILFLGRPPAGLLIDNENKPATFVIVGRVRKEITDDDAAQILRWVSEGGKLVLIDRSPADNLVATTANWRIFFNTAFRQPSPMIDASNQKEMTTGIRAAKPVQPSLYTQSVNAVQTSVFVTSVNFEHLNDEEINNRSNRNPYEPAPLPTCTEEGRIR